jgi:phosphoenolpyruvate synthase/pyruvate phosphate dikinase
MTDYVLGFEEIDRTQIARVGGKGAQLGELSRIEGITVPAGFCVTTAAFQRIVAHAPSFDEQLARLTAVRAEDGEAIRTISAEIRRSIEGIAIPDDLAAALNGALSQLGAQTACAVRSSATAEDLPMASFAGQQDTYLNVAGSAAILAHVSRCWASLFTDRAVTYRLQNGFDQRMVHMAVIVQRMVFPHAAGILFTADPITSNRKVAIVEAAFGLGEALVSGLVNPDTYAVRDGEIVAKAVALKQRAFYASPIGGTQEQSIELERQAQPALTDTQVIELARLGRRIEAHFRSPQDIEWCLMHNDFQFVQSRPITALFPIPRADDDDNHVYLSVGHQQMMTDALKPLGISFWQLTALPPMHEAGGRLFVDVTARLASTAGRVALLEMMGRSDPLMRDALETVLARADFLPPVSDERPGAAPMGAAPTPIATDPAIVSELMARTQDSLATLRRAIRTKSGPALIEFIVEDIQELRRILFDPRGHQVFMSAMEATWWLNDQLQAWLGEKNVADTLAQSVHDNVTSEMGLALLDVADVIRPHHDVVAFLGQVEDDNFLDQLPQFAGGLETREAIVSFLDTYGMRGAGEIDITRPRWSERPTTLVPLILGNIKNFAPGTGPRRFAQGRQEAWQKEQEILARVRALPDGEHKAEEVKAKIDRVRTFIGYREYPKYGMISRYFIYKQALWEEAGRLVQEGLLRDRDDIFSLTLQELHEVVRTHRVDHALIRQRRDAYRSYRALTPPRVLTSEGEAIAGTYRRDDVPAGALVGLPVSGGTVEGRARVILDMVEAALDPGDILVTTYTDPSWTPLFVTIKGLVTEVGGLMTHGAVIAREYGLPAVVGVEHATQLIRDGQRIRVQGTEGYIEILP